MLAGAFLSAFNGAMTKMLAEYISPFEIVFYRNLLGVFIILYTLRLTPTKSKGGSFTWLVARGVFGSISMLLFFYTISTIPLAEAIALNKTSPFFVSILAFFFMKEKINISTIVALIIGFIGITLIVKPFGIHLASYNHILGALSGLFAAMAYTVIKKIKNIYDTRIIMLSFLGVGTIVPAFFIDFIFYQDYKIWLFLGVMAPSATMGQWLLTKAYSMSKASIIGVISYANISFAIGFGWALGDSFPDIWVFVGICMIILGGVLVGKKSKN